MKKLPAQRFSFDITAKKVLRHQENAEPPSLHRRHIILPVAAPLIGINLISPHQLTPSFTLKLY